MKTNFLIAAMVLSALLTMNGPLDAAPNISECGPTRIQPSIVEGQSISTLSRDAQGMVPLKIEKDGHYLMVYADEASAGAALSYGPCLLTQIDLLRVLLDDDRRVAEWDSVVFTSDENYTPPRSADIQDRWVIYTGSSVKTGQGAQNMIMGTIPHEQVHEFQTRAGARLPRWFREGHAEWIGSKVSSMIAPAFQATQKAELLAPLDGFDDDLDLKGWGSVRPTREAIMRQVSPAEQAKMREDPTYQPNGTFRFTQDDLETDMSNELPRYAAPFLVFERLEGKHGFKAVQQWAKEVTSKEGKVSHKELKRSFRDAFDMDLDEALAWRASPG